MSIRPNGENKAESNEIKTTADEAFPWLCEFKSKCQCLLAQRSTDALIRLMKFYTRNVSVNVAECYTKPFRAAKLKDSIGQTLLFFLLYYRQLGEIRDRDVYLDKMSDILAMYTDMELKASRRGKEHDHKIAARIVSCLHIYLESSSEHVLETLMRARFINRNYHDILDPVITKILKTIPHHPNGDLSFVRYLLIYRLWKKVNTDARIKNEINATAISRLGSPPSNPRPFLAKHVLPKVPKSQANSTKFLLLHKFDIEKACRVFVQYCKEMREESNQSISVINEKNTDAPKALGVVSGTYRDTSREDNSINEATKFVSESEKSRLPSPKGSRSKELAAINESTSLETKENIFSKLTKPRKMFPKLKINKTKNNEILFIDLTTDDTKEKVIRKKIRRKLSWLAFARKKLDERIAEKSLDNAKKKREERSEGETSRLNSNLSSSSLTEINKIQKINLFEEARKTSTGIVTTNSNAETIVEPEETIEESRTNRSETLSLFEIQENHDVPFVGAELVLGNDDEIEEDHRVEESMNDNIEREMLFAKISSNVESSRSIEESNVRSIDQIETIESNIIESSTPIRRIVEYHSLIGNETTDISSREDRVESVHGRSSSSRNDETNEIDDDDDDDEDEDEDRPYNARENDTDKSNNKEKQRVEDISSRRSRIIKNMEDNGESKSNNKYEKTRQISFGSIEEESRQLLENRQLGYGDGLSLLASVSIMKNYASTNERSGYSPSESFSVSNSSFLDKSITNNDNDITLDIDVNNATTEMINEIVGVAPPPNPPTKTLEIKEENQVICQTTENRNVILDGETVVLLKKSANSNVYIINKSCERTNGFIPNEVVNRSANKSFNALRDIKNVDRRIEGINRSRNRSKRGKSEEGEEEEKEKKTNEERVVIFGDDRGCDRPDSVIELEPREKTPPPIIRLTDTPVRMEFLREEEEEKEKEKEREKEKNQTTKTKKKRTKTNFVDNQFVKEKRESCIKLEYENDTGERSLFDYDKPRYSDTLLGVRELNAQISPFVYGTTNLFALRGGDPRITRHGCNLQLGNCQKSRQNYSIPTEITRCLCYECFDSSYETTRSTRPLGTDTGPGLGLGLGNGSYIRQNTYIVPTIISDKMSHRDTGNDEKTNEREEDNYRGINIEEKLEEKMIPWKNMVVGNNKVNCKKEMIEERKYKPELDLKLPLKKRLKAHALMALSFDTPIKLEKTLNYPGTPMMSIAALENDERETESKKSEFMKDDQASEMIRRDYHAKDNNRGKESSNGIEIGIGNGNGNGNGNGKQTINLQRTFPTAAQRKEVIVPITMSECSLKRAASSSPVRVKTTPTKKAKKKAKKSKSPSKSRQTRSSKRNIPKVNYSCFDPDIESTKKRKKSAR